MTENGVLVILRPERLVSLLHARRWGNLVFCSDSSLATHLTQYSPHCTIRHSLPVESLREAVVEGHH